MQFTRLGTCALSISIMCGGAFAQNAQDQLVSRAKAEGKVVLYASSGTGDLLKPALAAWERLAPGVKVEVVEATGPENMERIRAERRARRPVADVVSLGDIAAFQFADEKAYKAIDPALLPNFSKLSTKLSAVIDPEHRHFPTYVQAYGIMVNTQLVPEADRPKHWADLLSPKFTRKIGIHDFSRVGGGGVWLMIGLPVLGEDYFAKLAKSQIRVFGRSPELISAVARGERAVGVPGNSGSLKDNPGAPIKLIYPEDGAYFISINAGVIADAPHPAAATLFLNFLMGPEVQAQYAKEGNLPVRDDVPSEGLSLNTAKFLGVGFQTPADAPKIKQVLDLGAKLLAP